MVGRTHLRFVDGEYAVDLSGMRQHIAQQGRAMIGWTPWLEAAE